MFRKKDGGIIGLRFQLRPGMAFVAKKRSAIRTTFDNKIIKDFRINFSGDLKTSICPSIATR